MEEKNFTTAEWNCKYYDEVPVLIITGQNVQKEIYGDEARELFMKLVVK